MLIAGDAAGQLLRGRRRSSYVIEWAVQPGMSPETSARRLRSVRPSNRSRRSSGALTDYSTSTASVTTRS
jgi:hypothetical protein